jgi:hypothetical protein
VTFGQIYSERVDDFGANKETLGDFKEGSAIGFAAVARGGEDGDETPTREEFNATDGDLMGPHDEGETIPIAKLPDRLCVKLDGDTPFFIVKCSSDFIVVGRVGPHQILQGLVLNEPLDWAGNAPNLLHICNLTNATMHA